MNVENINIKRIETYGNVYVVIVLNLHMYDHLELSQDQNLIVADDIFLVWLNPVINNGNISFYIMSILVNLAEVEDELKNISIN